MGEVSQTERQGTTLALQCLIPASGEEGLFEDFKLKTTGCSGKVKTLLTGIYIFLFCTESSSNKIQQHYAAVSQPEFERSGREIQGCSLNSCKSIAPLWRRLNLEQVFFNQGRTQLVLTRHRLSTHCWKQWRGQVSYCPWVRQHFPTASSTKLTTHHRLVLQETAVLARLH